MTAPRVALVTIVEDAAGEETLGDVIAEGRVAEVTLEPVLVETGSGRRIPSAWRAGVEFTVRRPSRELLDLYGLDVDAIVAEAQP